MAQAPTNEQIVRLLEEVKAELAEVTRAARRALAVGRPALGVVGWMSRVERRH